MGPCVQSQDGSAIAAPFSDAVYPVTRMFSMQRGPVAITLASLRPFTVISAYTTVEYITDLMRHHAAFAHLSHAKVCARPLSLQAFSVRLFTITGTKRGWQLLNDIVFRLIY